MKIATLLLPLLLACPLLPAAAQAAAIGTATRSVDVSGSAEIKVAPDEILLNVGVETRNVELAPAKRLNDERVAAALAFLARSGVPGKDVQTDFISIEPQFDYDDTDRASQQRSRLVPVMYVVRKSIGIRLTKVEDFETVLAGLLDNGVQYIHGIEFRTSQLRKHRDAARALAVQAAKDKADALTAGLGARRGAVQQVSESYSGGWWRSGSAWGGGGRGQMMQNTVQNLGGGEGGDGATLSVGQISVSASVDVTFAIE